MRGQGGGRVSGDLQGGEAVELNLIACLIFNFYFKISQSTHYLL